MRLLTPHLQTLDSVHLCSEIGATSGKTLKNKLDLSLLYESQTGADCFPYFWVGSHTPARVQEPVIRNERSPQYTYGKSPMGLARGQSLGLRKCASLPSLSDCGSDRALEVYCGKRQLIELSTKVPTRLHGFLEDIGVAHYFVIVKQTTDGSLTQFDFGPVGGDIAFPQFNSLELPARGVMGNGDKRNAKRLKQAEIREMKVCSAGLGTVDHQLHRRFKLLLGTKHNAK